IQARQLAINVPIIVSSLTNLEVQEAGIAAEGAITFAGWLTIEDTPGNRAFVENYKKTFSESQTTFSAWAYTALYLLAHAVEQAQSTHPALIQEQLTKITDFDTILGKFSFNTDGDAVYSPKILVVKNGMFQPF
ncbi:MAG: ABC transporter substrate-binding protein, partial [Candidatus Poribacteria bacterium]|nr:ABC transporter substrate-binding protein [Candidatus Poribacteria bacterium]